MPNCTRALATCLKPVDGCVGTALPPGGVYLLDGDSKKLCPRPFLGVGGSLTTPTQAQNQMEGGLFLDVVVRQCTTIFKLLPGKNLALLVWGDALLVLDLGLDVVNGVRGFDIKSDGLACEGLDEDLHATAQAQNQMQRGLFLDVVVRQGAAILELLAGEDEALLVRGDAFLVLDLGLDVVDGA